MPLKYAVALSLLTLALLAGINLYIFDNAKKPPNIQGVIVPEARHLQDFTLVSHKNEPFTNSNLRGQWSLISYGFTDCPDICPTTLNKMAHLEKRLRELGRYTDLQILFYTVDPERDTVERLANYIEFFSDAFIGLTWGGSLDTKNKPFESSLGMVSSIQALPPEEAATDYKGYSVSHGVVLYLLNPDGELQAILKPDIDVHGMHHFSVDKMYRDYLAIRRYFG